MANKPIKKILLIFALAILILPQGTHAANLSISPSVSNMAVGDTVTLRVVVNTLDKWINNAEGTILFPADKLEVKSISKSSSIFSLWVEQPSFSNNAGQITFNGGLPTPGFSGASGSIITITFRAKKTGSAFVHFSSGAVRENDGAGTDITGSYAGATITIKSAQVAPPPTPAPAPAPTPQPVVTPPEIPAQVAPPPPQAPEIAYRVENNNAYFIYGTSGYSNNGVLITLAAGNGEKTYLMGTADEKGSFNVKIPDSIRPGLYAVTAVMVKADRSYSETSNALAIMTQTEMKFYGISKEMWLYIIIISFFLLDLLIHIFSHLLKKKESPSSIM